jgi:hypothetical protein
VYERFERAEKLLMRVRSLKWQAMNIRAVGTEAAPREAAAAIIAAVEAIERGAREPSSDDALVMWEQQADALGTQLLNLSRSV